MSSVAVRPGVHRLVAIAAGDASIDAELSVQVDSTGVVVCCHEDTEAERTRGQEMARLLAGHRLGTCRIGLPAGDEAEKGVLAAIDWAKAAPELRGLPLGIYVTDACVGGAMRGVSQRPFDVGALVVSGGSLDGAGSSLAGVRAPTLLIVDACDVATIGRSAEALRQIRATAHLAIAPAAPDERRAQQQLSEQAAAWFRQHASLDAEA